MGCVRWRKGEREGCRRKEREGWRRSGLGEEGVWGGVNGSKGKG